MQQKLLEVPPHLSGYEWDLLEERGYVAGLPQAGWYEVFLAYDDIAGLARLSEFYHPPPTQVQKLISADESTIAAVSPRLVTDRRLLDYLVKDPAAMYSLTPRQFELFIAELLETLGYFDVRVGSGSKDGGVDVTAMIRHEFGIERMIVQCKHYRRTLKVGETTVKQLMTDVELHQAARGLIVTTSTLTRPARLLVESYRYLLSSFDGGELETLLTKFGRRD
jgi:hypothetical protein